MNNKTKLHILNALRHATVTWHVRNDVIKRSSKVVDEGHYLNGKTKTKRHYQCELCKEWFRNSSSLEVDHVEEIGSFSGDFNAYILRMFCDETNLMLLCIACHLKKTTKSARERWERRPRKK